MRFVNILGFTIVGCVAACGGVRSLSFREAQIGSPDRVQAVATSNTAIWNAVAVDHGRVFLAGPRWTGSRGPQLSVLDVKGVPQPYPDVAWNSWKPGADPTRAFVNINAIRLDGTGGLWVIDTGSPTFGGDPLPGGAKLVRIGLSSAVVDRIVTLNSEIARPGSYVDDVRFGHGYAYLTDAGKPGLIVINLASGEARRVLDGHASVTARADRDIVVDGRILKAPNGSPLRVNADPLELTPDGQWLCYGPLAGPWSRVPTRLLNDPSMSEADLARGVEPWADLPPVGGTAMSATGDLYFSDLAVSAIKKRSPEGVVTTVLEDPRLHWADALVLDGEGMLWIPVPQIDRIALFNQGVSKIAQPVALFRMKVAD